MFRCPSILDTLSIGTTPVAPQTGVIVLRGNTANTKGRGVELSLSSHNLRGKFLWDTDLLFSYAADRVSRYLTKPSSVASAYLTGGSLVPAEGKPLYAVYSYGWAGLDPVTGDPQGYLTGEVSKNYAAIKSSATLEGLVYNHLDGVGPFQMRPMKRDKIKQRDKTRTYQKMLDAVGHVIATAGTSKVTVQAVADLAGVNKVLVYRYFGSVENLIEQYFAAVSELVLSPGELLTHSADLQRDLLPGPGNDARGYRRA